MDQSPRVARDSRSSERLFAEGVECIGLDSLGFVRVAQVVSDFSVEITPISLDMNEILVRFIFLQKVIPRGCPDHLVCDDERAAAQ